ncbi:hypothetical protein LCGC14_1404840 [marine sediment metagenome]|uniref:Uncharacterized protein n=1 Tax=marine sediment metagenome TaxID=412755 RepID=A0A0F9MBF4_9ZZZZ
MDPVIIGSISVVTVALLGAVAYGGPKALWYWGQIKLLQRAQSGAEKMMDIHIADHTEDVDELTITVGDPTQQGQYL